MKKYIFTLLTVMFAVTVFAAFGPTPISQFSISSLNVNKNGIYTMELDYTIEEGIHLYITSKIAKKIKFIFADGVKIEKLTYPSLIKKGTDTYISGSGKIIINLSGKLMESGSFKVTYQGCSEDGICYIPETVDVSYQNIPNKSGKKEKLGVSGLLKKNIKNPILAILLVFFAGILTSLTPCVYPMIPITISYFGKRGEGQTIKSNFVGTLFYVLGLALTYTSLGIIAGLTGSAFGSITNNRYVLIVFAGLFFIMAFMMCDYIVLNGGTLMNSATQNTRSKRSFFQPFLLGLLTGLIASPCIGPVVLFLLALIIKTGNILYGGILMFFFSLGLGLLFIILGTFSGAINKLPSSGNWMEKVKVVFSILMVLVATYFLNISLKGFSVIGANFISYGIGIMFILFFLGFFDKKKWDDDDPFKRKKKEMLHFILFIVLLFGIGLFLKGILSNNASLSGIKNEIVKNEQLHWYNALDKGLENANEHNRLIFVDFGADWCVMCREFEELVKRDTEIIRELKKYTLVRLDYNKNKELARDEFKVLGLPTFLILDKNANVIKRETGFKNVTDLKNKIIDGDGGSNTSDINIKRR